MTKVVAIVFGFLALVAGCVIVRDHGTYQRTNSVIQSGTNKASQVDFGLKP